MNLLPNDDLHGWRVFIHSRQTRSEGNRSTSEGKTGIIFGRAASASLSYPGEVIYWIHLEKDPLLDGYRRFGSFYRRGDFVPLLPRLPRYGVFVSQAPVLHPPPS